MNISDKRSAAEFIGAWRSHGTRGQQAMRHAAESQDLCASIERTYKRDESARKHSEAASMLREAAQS